MARCFYAIVYYKTNISFTFVHPLSNKKKNSKFDLYARRRNRRFCRFRPHTLWSLFRVPTSVLVFVSNRIIFAVHANVPTIFFSSRTCYVITVVVSSRLKRSPSVHFYRRESVVTATRELLTMRRRFVDKKKTSFGDEFSGQT